MALLIDPEESAQQIEHQPLTGLSDTERQKRVDWFKVRLHEEILRSQRRKYPFTLIRLSVARGESKPKVSSAVEDVLRSCIREYDFICPWKADEFLIAFPETGAQSAELIAGRLREAILAKEWSDAVSQALNANIGIACFPQDGTNAEDLLKSLNS
jgi:GGDEF domain-containing protein